MKRRTKRNNPALDAELVKLFSDLYPNKALRDEAIKDAKRVFSMVRSEIINDQFLF